MKPDKLVRADVFLDFMERAEETIEILSSEIPIDDPRRERIEPALKSLREYIQRFRESAE